MRSIYDLGEQHLLVLPTLSTKLIAAIATYYMLYLSGKRGAKPHTTVYTHTHTHI